MPKNPKEIDVLILCALKDEYDQLLQVRNGIGETGWTSGYDESGWYISDAVLQTAGGSNLNVRASWAPFMGREQAMALTASLIQKMPIKCLAMCGICAGRKEKVSLGDVIFADRLWSYDAGKVVTTSDGDVFEGDMLQYRPSGQWVQRMQAVNVSAGTWLKLKPALSMEWQEKWVLQLLVQKLRPEQADDFASNCPDWGQVKSRLQKRKWVDNDLIITQSGIEALDSDALSDRYTKPEFKIHVAPIATGAAVVEDDGIFARLVSGGMRKVLGVDMEASGMGAIAEVSSIPVIVVKAVSDFGNFLKDDRYRTFSARAAAEALVELLRHSYDLIGMQNRNSTQAVFAGKSSTLPIELIGFFAENYPDVSDARALWQRAGGRGSDVENVQRPFDLWQRMWLRSSQGASVTPKALILAALADFPENAILMDNLMLIDR